MVPSIEYSNVPEPPLGFVIVIDPSLPPKHKTLVELNVPSKLHCPFTDLGITRREARKNTR